MGCAGDTKAACGNTSQAPEQGWGIKVMKPIESCKISPGDLWTDDKYFYLLARLEKDNLQ